MYLQYLLCSRNRKIKSYSNFLNSTDLCISVASMFLYSMSKYQLYSPSILLIFLFIACSSEKDISFKSKSIDGVSVFLQADATNKLAAPAWIKSTAGGFFLFEAKHHKIYRYDMEGNRTLSFGSRGRGPGEYQQVGDFWEFEDSFLVYDMAGQKLVAYDSTGNHKKDILLDFIEFSGVPVGMEAISSQKFVMPSGGKNGSLLQLIDIEAKDTRYFGTAVDKKVNSLRLQPPDKRHQAISSGEIPAGARNDVLLSSNGTGVFSFQQSTAKLEKYDFSGKLIWQKNLKVPPIDGLFERLFEENRVRIKGGEMLLSFSYADGISANEDGVAVKFNLFEGQPVTVAWVPNDGEKTAVVTFPKLKNLYPVSLRFTISDDGSHILFSNLLEGKVYIADWLKK